MQARVQGEERFPILSDDGCHSEFLFSCLTCPLPECYLIVGSKIKNRFIQARSLGYHIEESVQIAQMTDSRQRNLILRGTDIELNKTPLEARKDALIEKYPQVIELALALESNADISRICKVDPSTVRRICQIMEITTADGRATRHRKQAVNTV